MYTNIAIFIFFTISFLPIDVVTNYHIEFILKITYHVEITNLKIKYKI